MIENYVDNDKKNKFDNLSPIYNSEGFVIEKYTRDNINSRVPKSLELKEKYPDLYKFLSFDLDTKNFNIGFIHVDMDGEISQQLASEGKNTTQIGFYLIKLLKDNLSQIAKKLKDEQYPEINKIEFLINISRLGSAENYLKKMGFEIFNIDDSQELARFHSKSHKLVVETHSELSEKNHINKNPKEEKPSKIILISKEAILDNYLTI